MSGDVVIDSLTLRYGGVRAVDDVSARFAGGAVHGVIGPNGAGKTTLLNALSGLMRPVAGTVSIGPQDVTRWKPHHLVRRAGLVRTYQTVRLFASMSVHENVLVAAGCTAPRAEVADRVDAVLERLELTDVRHERAASLSYGLQRRVELARALVIRPAVLLLDEPAAGLSPVERQALAALLTSVRDEGTTVVLVEHHMDLVHAICEHCIVLDFGRVISEGTPEHVTSDDAVLEAYLGSGANGA